MRWTKELRVKLAIVGGLLLLSTLTACTVSAAGGIIGGAGALVFGVFLLLSTGTTQTGCGPCLSPVHPCLSEPYIPDDAGPLVTPIDGQSAIGTFDAAPYVGPCLSIAQPMPDAGVAPDMPCLSPEPRTGPCLSPPDPDIGPCLSEPWFDDRSVPVDPLGPQRPVPLIDDRATSIEKLQGKLPPDVVRRLVDRKEE